MGDLSEILFVPAIQACYHLNRDNLDRDLNGLMEALSFFNLKEGTIVTPDQKDRFGKNGLTVHVVDWSYWNEENR